MTIEQQKDKARELLQQMNVYYDGNDYLRNVNGWIERVGIEIFIQGYKSGVDAQSAAQQRFDYERDYE